ncbi:MAG: hypothetical protein ABW250_06890 [Pyrinomonadaceae bacterium]
MESQLEYLRRRFDSEAWVGKGASAVKLSVREFVRGGLDLAGWHAESIRQVETEGWPPHLTSIWKASEGRPEALLSVEVFECASASDAHEFLLRALAEFQSPEVKRQETNAVGDVSFSVPGDAALLFAYANLVILIRNAGRELVPVTDVARQLQQSFANRSTQE